MPTTNLMKPCSTHYCIWNFVESDMTPLLPNDVLKRSTRQFIPHKLSWTLSLVTGYQRLIRPFLEPLYGTQCVGNVTPLRLKVAFKSSLTGLCVSYLARVNSPNMNKDIFLLVSIKVLTSVERC